MLWFIDDLSAINDSGEFTKLYNENYPLQLELKWEKKTDTEASFLDLDIKSLNEKFSSSFYDKRDCIQCSMVRMSYLCSNMSSHHVLR